MWKNLVAVSAITSRPPIAQGTASLRAPDLRDLPWRPAVPVPCELQLAILEGVGRRTTARFNCLRGGCNGTPGHLGVLRAGGRGRVCWPQFQAIEATEVRERVLAQCRATPPRPSAESAWPGSAVEDAVPREPVPVWSVAPSSRARRLYLARLHLDAPAETQGRVHDGTAGDGHSGIARHRRAVQRGQGTRGAGAARRSHARRRRAGRFSQCGGTGRVVPRRRSNVRHPNGLQGRRALHDFMSAASTLRAQAWSYIRRRLIYCSQLAFHTGPRTQPKASNRRLLCRHRRAAVAHASCDEGFAVRPGQTRTRPCRRFRARDFLQFVAASSSGA